MIQWKEEAQASCRLSVKGLLPHLLRCLAFRKSSSKSSLNSGKPHQVVNNSLSTPSVALHLKAKLWNKPSAGSPSTCEGKHLPEVLFASFPTAMAGLTADVLQDLIPEELRVGFSAGLG